MWSFTFMTFLTAFLLFPTIPLRIVDLGGTKAQAGAFLAVYTFACALAAPLSGTFADTIGRRRVLVFGAATFVVASGAYWVIESLPLLLLFASIHGACWSGLLSSSSAIITEIIPVSRRAEGLSWWGMASSGAVAFAPAIGLVMYRTTGWKGVIALMGVLSLFMFALSLRVRGGAPNPEARMPPLLDFVEWRVIVAALTLSCISFGYGGVTSYVAMLAMERNIEPPSLFFTVFALSIVVSRIILAPVADRRGSMYLLLPSLALIPASLWMLSWAAGVTTLALSAALYGVGFGCAYPAFVTWLLPRTSEARRGATFGSILWAFDTGIGAGSLMLGIAAERAGFRGAFLLAAAVGLLALPVFLFTSRLLPRRVAEAPAGGAAGEMAHS